MRTEFVNIPGTTLLIKSDDLIYSRLEVKVYEKQEIIPPASSDEDFVVATTGEIVFSIKSEYHSMVNADVAKSEGDESVPLDIKDEILGATAVVETLVFNTETMPLSSNPFYLLLEDKKKEKVDGWIKFYRRNIKWRERLSEMQTEQSEEIRRNGLAADEMADLSLNKTVETTFDSKIKILIQNLEEDDEKHSKRLKFIENKILSAQKTLFQSHNAYDICDWLQKNVDDSESTFDKINNGISRWVAHIKDALSNNYAGNQSVYGLNFISGDDGEIKPDSDMSDDDNVDPDSPYAQEQRNEEAVEKIESDRIMSLEEEAELTASATRPYTIKLDKNIAM